MQIKLISLLVNDQAKALDFYTRVIGFRVKHDIPMGEFRWLTVVSPDGVEGAEVVLEPTAFEPARVYQKALFDAGIPITAFMTHDIAAEAARLQAAGLVFRSEPRAAGGSVVALFEDGCGNLISLVQPPADGG